MSVSFLCGIHLLWSFCHRGSQRANHPRLFVGGCQHGVVVLHNDGDVRNDSAGEGDDRLRFLDLSLGFGLENQEQKNNNGEEFHGW